MIGLGICFDQGGGRKGIVIAGDRARSFLPGVIGESFPFYQLGDLPLVFLPAGASSAIALDFKRRIQEFVSESLREFSCDGLRNAFPKLYELLRMMARYYRSEEENGIFMDFLIGGSDGSGDVLLYYGYIDCSGAVNIEDIPATTGYALSLVGAREGYLLLKEWTEGMGELPERVAVAMAIQLLQVLREIRRDISDKIDLAVLKNGDVNILSDEHLEGIGFKGFLNVQWRATIRWLKDTCANPHLAPWSLKQLLRRRAASLKEDER